MWTSFLTIVLPDRRDDYFDEDEDGLFSRIGKKLDGIWVVHGEEHVIRGRVGILCGSMFDWGSFHLQIAGSKF